MYKQTIAIFALCAIACVALAAPPNDPEEIRQGAASAFAAGLSRFSNAVSQGDNEVPVPGPPKSQVFSLYTKGLKALGGGKPHLVDQYRTHGFTGVTTTKVPEDHHIISDELTPEQTAAMIKPGPVYQYSDDHLYIP